MPRPKKDGSAEPKKRSRTGCWPCKARKVKCGEEKPGCTNCAKTGEPCDYSIRLNWGGRTRKDKDGVEGEDGGFTFVTTPGHRKNDSNGHEHIFSSQHLAISRGSNLPTPEQTPTEGSLDPRLREVQQTTVQYAMPSYMNVSSAPRSAPATEEFRWSPQHSAKRIKLSPRQESSSIFAIPPMPDYSASSTYFTPHTISSIVNTPATPNSSITSGSPFPSATLPVVQDPPDLRRLSVKSLLSSDPELERPHYFRHESLAHTTYGYDHGFADLDTPRNSDFSVIQPRSPDLRRPSNTSTPSSSEETAIAFEPGGYYATPVPVRIPKSLEPLPRELLDNPMNLLYFHHFIAHTGRILVPHDCPENPFRVVLPLMATHNRHLLHLMLAYSASHRARLLNHPEPANRIAGWMDDVLPALREALAEPASPGASNSTDPSNLAPLATAIMLASLEIVSPHTFNWELSWQQHLSIARQLIINKGGLHQLSLRADGVRDKAVFFLSRWFAYLDVLGSFSGNGMRPLEGAYDEDGGGLWLVNRDPAEVEVIDCLFGFSGKYIALLARVAEMVWECDRLRRSHSGIDGGDVKPSPTMIEEANTLISKIRSSAGSGYTLCSHTSPQTPTSPTSTLTTNTEAVEEMFAVNAAFHDAALIHIYRHVLDMPTSAPEVQQAVQDVIASLNKVRRGSSAESNLLFPMFTAGCEALGEQDADGAYGGDRAFFRERLTGVEGWGMAQVERTRMVMEGQWRGEKYGGGDFFG